MISKTTHRTASKLGFRKEQQLANVGIAALARRAVFGLIAFGLASAPQVLAQATQTAAVPAPTFEVASIKPSPDAAALMASGKMPNVGMRIDESQVNIGFTSLAQLISTAYKVKLYQISGPDWIKTARFDIQAKMPDGATKEQVPDMLRALLEERFKLAIHRETKDEPVYALVVGKNGPKLTPSLPDPKDPPDPNRPPDKNEAVMDTPDGQVRIKTAGRGEGMTAQISGGATGPVNVSVANGTMHLEFSKTTMAAVAERLTPMLDRPVVDKTELTGTYVVALDLSMDDMMAAARASGLGGQLPGGGAQGADAGGAASAPDPSGHSIFASVEKLGLRLDREKTPFEFIVVDHLEKVPTEN